MITEKTQWLHAVPGGLISSNEVHVWRLLLNEHHTHVENLREFLSADELVRAGKFHFEKDQNRFILARGGLRMILGSYLGMKPHELCFEYTSSGKPALSLINDNDKISFNLSHSADMVLYAVTMNRNIGIDVEYIKDNIDVVQIANRFFSSSEIQSLDCIPDKERPGKFFQYWTRKEALAKAIGKGVSFPFEQCDVSLINGKALSPVKPTWPNTESTCWHIQDLFPGEGYAASISTEGGNLEISYLALSLE